ncbi:MAG: hypothetical protein WAK60_03250 [Sedimentisphaerales bacterium]
MKNQNIVFTFSFYLFTLPALWDTPFAIPSGYSLCLGVFVAEIQLAAAKPFGEDGSIKMN